MLLIVVAATFALVASAVIAVVIWSNHGSGGTNDDVGDAVSANSDPTADEAAVPAMFDPSSSPDEAMASILRDFCKSVTVGPLDNGTSSFVLCQGLGSTYDLTFTVFDAPSSFANGWDSTATGCFGTREMYAEVSGVWSVHGAPDDVSALVEIGAGNVVVTCDDTS